MPVKSTPSIRPARPLPVAGPLLALLLSLALTPPALAHRPDMHAPIRLMGDHAHHKGKWMLSYRAMHMAMDENLDGNRPLSPAQILDPAQSNYLVAPQKMTMQMHMLGLMYAPTERLTLMGMANYQDMSMDHQARNGLRFTTGSSGLGDTRIGGTYRLHQQGGAQWLLNLGLSLPTGSIDKTDTVPPINPESPAQLPFPMQLGSGTHDLLPGLTYRRMHPTRSWGAQASARLRLDSNSNGYRPGHRYQLTAWHAWPLRPDLSLSARLGLQRWGNYSDRDRRQPLPLFNVTANANTVPTVNPSLRAGKQADIALGTNIVWGTHRLAAELSHPFWHDLQGPQLAENLNFTLGYQHSF